MQNIVGKEKDINHFPLIYNYDNPNLKIKKKDICNHNKNIYNFSLYIIISLG